MSDKTIHTQSQDGVLFIRWQNPASKHALTRAMYTQLVHALQDAQARDDIKVCVLLGGEGDFCSGNDLAEFVAGREQGPEFYQPLLDFIHQLARFNKPLLASVNGWAVGIGATLLLHCDAVIASPQAQFSFPFSKLGLCVECGASLLLPMRVGQGRAADWLLRAEPVAAEEALGAGFINQVQEDSIQAITDYALRLTERPLAALVAHRQLQQAPWASALAQAMADEEAMFFKLLQSDDFQMIVAAMNAKWRSKNP